MRRRSRCASEHRCRCGPRDPSGHNEYARSALTCGGRTLTSGGDTYRLDPYPRLMLVHVTGVPGTGKSTLRPQLDAAGFLAADGDDGICAWFDRATGNQVSNMPLGRRTADWYENYQWRPIPGTIERLSAECANRTGFLLGVFGDAAVQGEHFGARFFLTAPTGVIEARLRLRDGHGYDTRFAAFGGLLAWQEAAESHWAREGYVPLDAARPVTAIANELLARVGLA
jgi:hypothetical protein